MKVLFIELLLVNGCPLTLRYYGFDFNVQKKNLQL